MDRYVPSYPWRGEAPRRGRRVPRRRPRRARVATWDGRAGIAWFVFLGILAVVVALLPRMVLAQGLRSQPATVTLTVIAPPRERPESTTTGGRGITALEVDVVVPFAVAAGSELTVRALAADSTSTTLYVRASDGRLARLGREWVRLRAAESAAFRAVGPSREAMAGTRHRVRFRIEPPGEGQATVERDGLVIVPTKR